MGSDWVRYGFNFTALNQIDSHTPEYHWIEFWRAVLGLLEFLTKKIDELQSAAGIRLLIKEVRSPAMVSFTPEAL